MGSKGAGKLDYGPPQRLAERLSPIFSLPPTTKIALDLLLAELCPYFCNTLLAGFTAILSQRHS